MISWVALPTCQPQRSGQIMVHSQHPKNPLCVLLKKIQCKTATCAFLAGCFFWANRPPPLTNKTQAFFGSIWKPLRGGLIFVFFPLTTLFWKKHHFSGSQLHQIFSWGPTPPQLTNSRISELAESLNTASTKSRCLYSTSELVKKVCQAANGFFCRSVQPWNIKVNSNSRF